ncbi:hypothetical protein M9H77_09823 [Catharanthus roseus]|uniref:Uncharacterized protein n=1 Tax=Catharanthus roseus TaxID=4058 RepID=A0ACC0C262_CATRO|nr:hypothetical protein M9H77_09823 [Catharanthus roseus]
MDVLVLLVCLILGVSYIFLSLLKWNERKYGRKGLPPGTMGWPVFGETLKFLEKGPDFMIRQQARYGNVFKSHILGSPTIISMDPELNRYILLNESKGLVPGYPQSTLDVLGENNIGAVSGSTHKKIRGSLMLLISSSAIKDQMLPKMDRDMRIFLQNWDGKTIDIQEKSIDMAFFIALKQIVEEESDSIYQTFKAEFDKLALGSLSLPIKLPGTNYYRGFQGRKYVIKILGEIIENRRACLKTHDDLLSNLLANADPRYELNDEEINDLIIMILDDGYETVSTTAMMAIKYLHDNPQALQELRNEHFMIRQGKSEEQAIDWNDYRMMKFTRAVIYETMRLGTIVNGVMRKATRDVELKDFVVPKGWKIYLYIREINYDSNLYPEPLRFNPWRWLEDTGLESHKYCFLFGGGSRLCPGKELGMVTISLFLHYFVTGYRWEEIGGQSIRKFPRVEAPNGLNAKVFKY